MTTVTFARVALGGALSAAAGVVMFGTISHADVQREIDAVPGARFSQMAPGRLYEVTRDGVVESAPLCFYAGADDAANQTAEPASARTFYNELGMFVPLAGRYLKISTDAAEGPTLAVEIVTRYARRSLDTLRVKPEPDSRCEDRAREATERGSVVCVVQSVLLSDRGDVVGLVFSPHAVLLNWKEGDPTECPLHPRNRFGGVITEVRSWLIASREGA